MPDLLLLPSWLNSDVKIYQETEYMPMNSPCYPICIVIFLLIFTYGIGPLLEELIYGDTEVVVNNETSTFYLSLGYDILAFSNILLAVTMSALIYQNDYCVWCQPINPAKEETIATIMWFFFITKIVESLEVFLWLLNNELRYRHSFFISFHHITAIILSWLAIKITPGGTAMVVGAINSWAHAVMYGYFMLKYRFADISILRQFVLLCVMLHFLTSGLISFTVIQKNCGFPRSIAVGMIFYMTSITIGFLLDNGIKISSLYFP